MNKFNIGIISERYQNDGEPVAYLLEQYFPNQAEYTQILTDFEGSKIGNKSFLRSLEPVFYQKNLDFIVIIKDLDEDENKEDIETFFKDCDTRLEGNMVSLCFVYMIEALAMADLETVCKHYKKNIKKIKINRNARHAKDELKPVFGYKESDIQDLVRKFDKQVLIQNYPVWREFINDFDKKLTYFIMR
jgi:hypothetical protein